MNKQDQKNKLQILEKKPLITLSTISLFRSDSVLKLSFHNNCHFELLGVHAGFQLSGYILHLHTVYVCLFFFNFTVNPNQL